MLVWLLNFFRGYVSVSAGGYFLERFINICIRRNIYLWDISKKSPTKAEMKMSMKGFKSIRPVAKKTYTSVRIIKKHGMPVVIKKYKKRYFFFIGLIIFISFIFAMSRFIWSVEVEGNKTVPREQILDTFKELGLYEGSYKGNLDVLELKNMGLLKLDKLNWLWVDIKGSKAVINVKEKTPVPYMVPKEIPCDIVASRPGVIKQINAKTGQAAVSVGQTVEEGDILVSGTVVSELAPPRYEHATGEVFARTWYEERGEYAPYNEVKTMSGRTSKKHSIKIFGGVLKFFVKEQSPYENYDMREEIHELSIFGNYMGISLESKIYDEYTLQKVDITPEEILAIAEKDLEAKILEQAGEVLEVNARNLIHEFAEDGSLKASLTMEFTQQIGVQREISPGQ